MTKYVKQELTIDDLPYILPCDSYPETLPVDERDKEVTNEDALQIIETINHYRTMEEGVHEALVMACKALEKLIAIKPYEDSGWYYCEECRKKGRWTVVGKPNGKDAGIFYRHCSYCGQAQDWSEE